MVSGPAEEPKRLVNQEDLDAVRDACPGWVIWPVLDGFEATRGDTVVKRSTLPGLEIAVRVASSDRS